MIGTIWDTLLNLIVFLYLGWLLYLWTRPARGELMPRLPGEGRDAVQVASEYET